MTGTLHTDPGYVGEWLEGSLCSCGQALGTWAPILSGHPTCGCSGTDWPCHIMLSPPPGALCTDLSSALNLVTPCQGVGEALGHHPLLRVTGATERSGT